MERHIGIVRIRITQHRQTDAIHDHVARTEVTKRHREAVRAERRHIFRLDHRITQEARRRAGLSIRLPDVVAIAGLERPRRRQRRLAHHPDRVRTIASLHLVGEFGHLVHAVRICAEAAAGAGRNVLELTPSARRVSRRRRGVGGEATRLRHTRTSDERRVLAQGEITGDLLTDPHLDIHGCIFQQHRRNARRATLIVNLDPILLQRRSRRIAAGRHFIQPGHRKLTVIDGTFDRIAGNGLHTCHLTHRRRIEDALHDRPDNGLRHQITASRVIAHASALDAFQSSGIALPHKQAERLAMLVANRLSGLLRAGLRCRDRLLRLVQLFQIRIDFRQLRIVFRRRLPLFNRGQTLIVRGLELFPRLRLCFKHLLHFIHDICSLTVNF